MDDNEKAEKAALAHYRRLIGKKFKDWTDEQVKGNIVHVLTLKHTEDLLGMTPDPVHEDDIVCALYAVSKYYVERSEDDTSRMSYVWFRDWLKPQYDEVLQRKPDHELTEGWINETVEKLKAVWTKGVCDTAPA